MAKSKIPNPMERRHLLERDLDASQLLRTADAYIAEERLVEAVDFLAKAGAEDRLEELGERAIEAGDAFLLKVVYGALDREPGRERWERLAAQAEAKGFDSYGETARRQASVVEE